MLIKRELVSELRSSARHYPVVTITGPRQSGKTTLVQRAFPKYLYFNLEEPDTRELALADPRGFLSTDASGIILDEIHRAPALLSYIQSFADQKKKSGQFILTGSQNFQLMESLTQSLAGRTVLLSLLPLSFRELKQKGTAGNLDGYLWKGFYPKIYAESLNPYKTYRSYYQTYIECDLRPFIHIKDLSLFQKFVRLCAGRIGQVYNASTLSSELGVSVPTVQAWLSILQQSYIVFMLQPYHSNIRKRIIKSPKIYFYDVGLAAYLLGIENIHQMSRDPLKGFLFENCVIMELVKYRMNRGMDHNLYFYRDDKKHEVDVLVQQGWQMMAVEIKSAQTFHSDFIKELRYVKTILKDKISSLVLIYAGGEHRGKEFRVLSYLNSSNIFSK